MGWIPSQETQVSEGLAIPWRGPSLPVAPGAAGHLLGVGGETTPASIAAAAEAAPSPTQYPSPERPRRHLRTAPSLVGFRRRLPLHPSQPQQRPLLLLHSRQVLNGLLPPPNSFLPGGLQKETTPASIAAAAEAAPSPTQQPSPERPPATSEQLPPWWASEGDYPPHPSQPQRRPLLLLHSSQVLNNLAATSKQLLPGGLQKETTPASITAAAEAAPSPTQQPSPERPPATSEQLHPWWASEGDYPRIHRIRSGGRSFTYTAAKS
ncbi:hypothetical protein NDU88_008198 [Pleurodeles waltl]|uniref:Uncharacterized protein n=1 Tax=Pleurodeles waltl TaxID=8319 RepID=A0AAV7U4L9_PLEWA|nr:hypothetical protein NDU88_008198 [Pleurodeles waltl]